MTLLSDLRPRLSLTISNDFHDTQASVVARKTSYIAPDGGTIYLISKRSTKRAWKALCGQKECVCSNSIGARGPQQCHGQFYTYYDGVTEFSAL